MKRVEVLIVEDDPVVGRALRDTLREMGHTVRGVVSSAEDALEAVREGGVELALLDIRIPGTVDGVDLGHRLRRDWEVAVVYVTGLADEATPGGAGASPRISYPSGPGGDRELRSAVEVALARDALERGLEARKRWYAAVLEAMEPAVLASDARGYVREMNPAAEELLGRPGSEAVGRVAARVTDLRDGDTGEPIADPLRAAMERDEPVHLPGSAVLRRPDGTWLPVSGAAAPVHVEGEPAAGAVLTLRDVRSERKSRAMTRRAEEHFRTVFREGPLPTHVSTLEEGRILDLNESFARAFGHPEADALGRRERTLELWAREKDREELLEALGEEGRVRGFRTRFRTRSGHLRHVDLSTRRIELEGTPCLLTITRDVTERVALEADLERQALYDTLTGLPNRTLLRDRLEHAVDRARREGSGTAVLFIDLDGFKAVNDTLGHAAGDEVLRVVARRIRDCFRDEDTVARIGGDEFAAVIEDAERRADAASSARRVLDVLTAPVIVRGRPVDVGASVGIALPGDAESHAGELLRRSDAAMYRAKQEGGGTFRIAEPGERARDEGAGAGSHGLRRALDEDEFILRYQPIVALDSGAVVGGEALVRWMRPGEDPVHPADFLPLAEESGLTRALGRRLLDLVCLDLERWSSPGGAGPFVTMNLLPAQFRGPELIPDVEGILADRSCDPSRIVLEVTEGVAFGSSSTIRGLRGLGVGVALDDVGTGLTSFSGLKELGVDLIKIHRSFIRGLGRDHAESVVVESLLSFGRGMGCDVVAEGVETLEQQRRLVAMGCGLGQGYYLGEPMEAEAFFERAV